MLNDVNNCNLRTYVHFFQISIKKITQNIRKMKIYIKNMICTRCKIVVKSELEKLNIKYSTIELGEVETINYLSPATLKMLDHNLRYSGLELFENSKNILAEKIKTAIIELVHQSDEQLKINLSDYLTEKLNYSYPTLAKTFSEVYHLSIEKFFISHKIERVKELLLYNDLRLKEISYLTNYSSIAHLSYQFKRITGVTPSEFRNLPNKSRLSLEQVSSY
jgi:AraC-like DNA-binding protein